MYIALAHQVLPSIEAKTIWQSMLWAASVSSPSKSPLAARAKAPSSVLADVEGYSLQGQSTLEHELFHDSSSFMIPPCTEPDDHVASKSQIRTHAGQVGEHRGRPPRGPLHRARSAEPGSSTST